MGIADWLVGIGIRAEEGVKALGTVAGVVAVQWPPGGRASLIHRLPRDPHQRASIFSAEQMILVNEGEIAVVLEDGAAKGVLHPGRYGFRKARITGSLDILWMATGQQALKWGLGNVTSTDGIQLSANGVAYLRVVDPLLFNTEVVQGAIAISEIELQRFLMPRLQGVLRALLAKWAALDLQSQRDVFVDAVKQSLGQTFRAMGLSIVDFEVVDINFPPEFKVVIAQAAMATHSGRAALVEAQTRAQMAQLEAVGAAQAHLLTGSAQVQVMALMQAQGLDPLKLKALDALRAFAEHPAQGGMMIGGDAARAGLFGQITAAALMPGAPPVVPPAHPGPAKAITAASATDSEAGPSVAELERQLDALTERLADGKLTEETYTKLAARLETRIAQVRGSK